MAWDDDFPVILRGLMLDYATPPTYADDRYNQLAVIAALGLLNEVGFARPYVISVSDVTISPDPTKLSPPDNAFVNLVCLKAALILVQAELRDMTRQGIEIQDGSSRLKLSRDAGSLRLMKQAYEEQYNLALYAYKTGAGGEAVVTPYSYLADWPTGMATMYEGCGGRSDRRNIGGYF